MNAGSIVLAINNMKNRITILIALVLLLTSNVFGQDDKLYQLLGKTVNVNDSFFTNKYLEKAYLFSVNMIVDKKGLIDSVVFSHYREDDDLGQIINFKKIKTDLTSSKIKLAKYKNKILVLMVFIIGRNDIMINIDNGHQLRDNWLNITKCTAEFPRDKLVLLVPWYITSLNSIIN